MPKIIVEAYEIVVKMIIRKDYWETEKKTKPTKELIQDLIETGLEVPVESFDIKIIE